MKSHTETVNIKTHQRDEMIDITPLVRNVINQSQITDGTVIIHIPHTTAGVTVNENADPDVVHDMLAMLDEMVPHSRSFYRHGEGNSAAHVKTTLTGCSQTLLLTGGKLTLGVWQSVWFCEFDGPRSRQAVIKIMPD